MTTKIGLEKKFASALQDLIALNYDAIEACNAAIQRLQLAEYRQKLEDFKYDYQKHILELHNILAVRNIEAPLGPDAASLFAKGKVILASILGDSAILQAMLSNEENANTAYERINDRTDIWQDAIDVLKNGLSDERKHRAWLETILR